MINNNGFNFIFIGPILIVFLIINQYFIYNYLNKIDFIFIQFNPIDFYIIYYQNKNPLFRNIIILINNNKILTKIYMLLNILSNPYNT